MPSESRSTMISPSNNHPPLEVIKRAKMTQAILLDMDGTIIQSNMGSLMAIRKALEEFYKEFNVPNSYPDDRDILFRMGMPSHDFFKSLLPPEFQDKSDILHEKATVHELATMREGRGWLFPGAKDTLTILKGRGYKLALVSNCSVEYFHGIIETYALDRFFEFAICLGEVRQGSKVELVDMTLSHFKTRNAAIVGDKHYDMEAGMAHNLLCIGCRYGFGSPNELEKAHHLISDIRELLFVFPGQ